FRRVLFRSCAANDERFRGNLENESPTANWMKMSWHEGIQAAEPRLCLAFLPQSQDPSTADLRISAHIAYRPRMGEHVIDHSLIRIQLRWRHTTTRKDALLPVAPHRGDRPLQHPFGKALANLGI